MLVSCELDLATTLYQLVHPEHAPEDNLREESDIVHVPMIPRAALRHNMKYIRSDLLDLAVHARPS